MSQTWNGPVKPARVLHLQTYPKNDDPHDLYSLTLELGLLRANWNTTVFNYVHTTRTERHLLPNEQVIQYGE